MVCTFFGHADTPGEAQTTLHITLVDLIENKNVDLFYVGNNGNFDAMVRNELEMLSITSPDLTPPQKNIVSAFIK